MKVFGVPFTEKLTDLVTDTINEAQAPSSALDRFYLSNDLVLQIIGLIDSETAKIVKAIEGPKQ